MTTTPARRGGRVPGWALAATKKPFDVLAEGLKKQNGRLNETVIELFLDAVQAE